MSIPRKRRNRRSGVAIIEFSLCIGFLVLLLLGTLVFGFRLIRNLQMEQIVRDVCHMYLRGVNFKNTVPNAQSTAILLAQSFDLSSSGSSVLILSQIKVLQQADCDAANPASPKGTHCTNLNNPVFTEQLMIGNTGLTINGLNVAGSIYGTPPLQPDQTVSALNQANTLSAAAGVSIKVGPPPIPGTGFASLLALNPGEYAYMVEMMNSTNELNIPGFSGRPQVYARSVF
jgi:hypothetical protein